MTPEARIEELRARLQLAQGSATLLLAIAESDAALDETYRIFLELLRATPIDVADLGEGGSSVGPARWAELTRAHAAPAFTLRFKPSSPLSISAFARVLNAERELLRQLAGPMVLVISRDTERGLRQHAPDFFTWVAQGYEIPNPRALGAIAAKLGVEAAEIEPKTPTEEPIRFLHISDLHLRPQRVKRYDQDRVLNGLITFLERDRAGFPLDLIFVTGDLAQSGKLEEYALVVEFLKRLSEVTAVALDRFFVVPGNHDVDRDVGRWLLRTLAKDEEAVAFFEEPKSRAFHEQKLAGYKQSMGALLGPARPLGLGVGRDAVEIVDIKGARLGVASFNSAWFAQGDDDQGKLWLGEPGAERAVDRIADEEATFAVALLHHPFDYFHEVERDVVERWLERGFDLVLRGHLHASKTRSIASQRGGFVEVAAPAAYQGSQWPNGCFLGEIRARARAVRLRPYAYSSGPDPWVLDPKVFPDDASDGYCRTFTAPEKRRTKSAVAKLMREEAAAVLKAASPATIREHTRRLAGGYEGVPGEPRAAEKEAASTARTLADTPELWTEVLGKDSLGLGLASAIVRDFEESSPPGGRITHTDIKALESALLRAGRAFLKVSSKMNVRHRVPENSAVIALGAALGAITDSAVAVDSMLSERFRGDILVGRAGASPIVIELKRVTRGRPLQKMLEGGLKQLDLYLSLADAPYGSLVLLDALKPDEAEPRVEAARTPAGLDVVVLHL
jgi:predicted MPP superfamily phosphohydrolase